MKHILSLLILFVLLTSAYAKGGADAHLVGRVEKVVYKDGKVVFTFSGVLNSTSDFKSDDNWGLAAQVKALLITVKAEYSYYFKEEVPGKMTVHKLIDSAEEMIKIYSSGSLVYLRISDPIIHFGKNVEALEGGSMTLSLMKDSMSGTIK